MVRRWLVLCLLVASCALPLHVWAIDTDGDTLPDDWEIAHGRDPYKADYAVAAGPNHQCAIDNEGVKCWGSNAFGQLNVPAGIVRPSGLSVGTTWSCACHEGGTTCWGTNPPASPTCSTATSGTGTATKAYFGYCGSTGTVSLACSLVTNGVACDLNSPSVTLRYSATYPYNCGTGSVVDSVTGQDKTLTVNAPAQMSQSNDRFCVLGFDGAACYKEQPTKWTTGGINPNYTIVDMGWEFSSLGVPAHGLFIDADHDGSPRPFDPDDLDPAVKDPGATLDSDYDTLPDSWEIAHGRDPFKPDYAMAVGKVHSCVIDDTGVKCFGNTAANANSNGQLDVPAGLKTRATHPYAVTVGDTWSCACNDAGSTCWGSGFPAQPSCTVSKSGFSPSVAGVVSACHSLGNGWSGSADLACNVNTAGDANCTLRGAVDSLFSPGAGPCGSVRTDIVTGEDKIIPANNAVQLDQNGKRVCTLGSTGFSCFDFTYGSDNMSYLPTVPVVVTWSATPVALPDDSQVMIDSDGDGSYRPYDPDDTDPAVSNPDDDGDGVLNAQDNCPVASNPDQLDTDGDGQGNVCDTDDDNDGVPDVTDKFPLDPTESADFDNDGIGDNADPDDDGDGVLDVVDNCLWFASTDVADDDQDGIGNPCDTDSAGKRDVAFNPGTGANNYVYAMSVLPGGKVIIGGFFTSYNGTPINRIARLNADGSLDTSFNPGTGVNDGTVESLAVQPDGKIIIGGFFSSVNGTPINRIARINTDGSLDSSFNPGSGASSHVYAMIVQPDGKIVIGGDFTAFNGVTKFYIARLNPDGSLDNSFNAGSGAYNTIYAIAQQADGKMVIAGNFTSFNGTPINRIARLNPDGSLDASFNPGTGVNSTVFAMALQRDGKIIIGGDFGTYNGNTANRIARLNADGSLDTGFNPGSGASYIISSIVMQADGKLVIGGSFVSFNGAVVNYIARLNADGSLDSHFYSGVGANGSVQAMAVHPSGRIIIGGYFNQYNGANSYRVASVHTGDPDRDGIENAADNCTFVANADQADADHNGVGDACDAGPHGDLDGDGIDNLVDNCPLVANTSQTDTDGDGIGDVCDSTPHGDTDGDGVDNLSDNCPTVANADQKDTDGDGKGDACDSTPNGDSDNDGVDNLTDNCPIVANADQKDTDSDGIGDACDSTPNGDTDGDGVDNLTDNCPAVANADQLDSDFDGVGNVCDLYPNDPTLLLQQDGAAKGEQLGGSVAMADMNNDGVVDLLVGSPLATVTINGTVLKKAGQIQIISGKDNSVLRTINGSAANAQLGAAMAVVPDQNKDGVPDIVVGDPLADVTTLTPTSFPVLKDAGRVMLYSGLDGRMLLILAEGKHAGDHFGAAVAAADVNGDSKVDLVVGAPRVDASSKDAGQVTVFNGLTKTVLYTRNGQQAGENFGAAVAVDSGHLFVGSPLFDAATAKDAGRVSIFNSNEGNSAALLTVEGSAKSDNFGASITAANDSWAAGAPLADGPGRDAGSVQVFTGLNAMPIKTLNGATAGDNFGSALSMQGDVNKDGINDIAIGANRFDAAAGKDAGRVQVLNGAGL